MEISTQTLKQTIKTLVKNQQIDDIVEVMSNEMSDVQLQNVIYCIMDPAYHSKTKALTNPARFTTEGVLNPERVEDVKLEKTKETPFDGLIEIK